MLRVQAFMQFVSSQVVSAHGLARSSTQELLGRYVSSGEPMYFNGSIFPIVLLGQIIFVALVPHHGSR